MWPKIAVGVISILIIVILAVLGYYILNKEDDGFISSRKSTLIAKSQIEILLISFLCFTNTIASR